MALALSRSAFFAVDVPTAMDFYRTAFGLRPSLVDARRSYAEFQIGGALLVFVDRHLTGTAALLGRLCGRPAPGHGEQDDPLSLSSDDFARDWERALAAGATILAAPANGTAGLLRDPCGVIVELSAQPRSAASSSQRATTRHRILAAADPIQAGAAGC